MAIPGEQPFQPRGGRSAHEVTPCEILIVDDDPGLRRTFPRVLGRPGRRFDECASVGEAIIRLERQRYDLVLLDYRLPDATGLSVLEWLSGREREEAVILISGEDTTDAVIGALRGGADDYVRKPYSVAQLQRVVDGALHKAALQAANRAMSHRLKASEQLHRYLVETSPDLIFTLDAEGRFSYLNPRVGALLGYDRQSLIKRPFASIVAEEDVERLEAQLSRPGRSFTLELRLLRRQEDGDRRPGEGITVSLTAIPMEQADGPFGPAAGLYGVARDISERKRAEAIISFQAYHDQLTHLPNRALFKDRLELAIAQARRRGGMLAVMFADVDRFKLVNDSYGHAEGDALLRGIASRLSETLRRGDTLARLGGDEFTILLPDVGCLDDVESVARKIIATLGAPFKLSRADFRATVSIGIALFPRDGDSAEDLIRHADIAMYGVKRSGKNAFRFFEPELISHHHDRIRLENALRLAFERDELELHYQPQVSLSRKAIVGVEALLRWTHPTLGSIPPSTFIPVAEEIGLIGEISAWVMERACRQLAEWRAAGHTALRMSLNLSPHDFGHRDIVDTVIDCVRRHHLPPAQIELEITESLMMNDSDGVAAKVRALRDAGLSVAIDDFGVGYSALAYLQKFPVSTIKIDRSFVRELSGQAGNPIISAITGIARGFGLSMVAEGVEEASQVETLGGLGCDVMQGYLFARPAAAEQVGRWLDGGIEAMAD